MLVGESLITAISTLSVGLVEIPVQSRREVTVEEVNPSGFFPRVVVSHLFCSVTQECPDPALIERWMPLKPIQNPHAFTWHIVKLTNHILPLSNVIYTERQAINQQWVAVHRVCLGNELPASILHDSMISELLLQSPVYKNCFHARTVEPCDIYVKTELQPQPFPLPLDQCLNDSCDWFLFTLLHCVKQCDHIGMQSS